MRNVTDSCRAGTRYRFREPVVASRDLGAGGIGGLLAAALARGGMDVVLLVRRERLADFDGRLVVESRVLGDFEVVVSVGVHTRP